MAKEDAGQLYFVRHVRVEGRLARNAFRFAIGADPTIVKPLRKAPKASAVLAEARSRRPFVDPLQIADQPKAQPFQPLLPGLADAPQSPDALRRKPGLRLFPPEQRKAPRLVEIGGELRQKLAVGEPDRNRHADLGLHAASKPHEHFGRSHSVRALASGEVEIGFVDRQGLDQRGQLLHQRANVSTGARIFGHVRRQDDGPGAERQRPTHRHRRADAEGSRDIAAGRYDAARPEAADDHRLVAKVRLVALFHRGVEGVAIDMRDLKASRGLEVDRSRRPAAGTARGVVRTPRQAVPTEQRRGRVGHDPSGARGPLSV